MDLMVNGSPRLWLVLVAKFMLNVFRIITVIIKTIYSNEHCFKHGLSSFDVCHMEVATPDLKRKINLTVSRSNRSIATILFYRVVQM
jgi:hypothetical protein